MNKKRKTQFGVLSAALLMALTLQPVTNTVYAQETSGEQIVAVSYTHLDVYKRQHVF